MPTYSPSTVPLTLHSCALSLSGKPGNSIATERLRRGSTLAPAFFLQEKVQNSQSFFSTAEELLARPYELSLKKCTQLSEKNLTIARSEVTQVLPPSGIYRVKNEAGESIRLEITADSLIFDVQSNLLTVSF